MTCLNKTLNFLSFPPTKNLVGSDISKPKANPAFSKEAKPKLLNVNFFLTFALKMLFNEVILTVG